MGHNMYGEAIPAFGPATDTTNTQTLSPDLPQLRQRVHAENRAKYLRDADLGELADWIGAIAAELLARGVQVAGPLGTAAARVEAYEERTR